MGGKLKGGSMKEIWIVVAASSAALLAVSAIGVVSAMNGNWNAVAVCSICVVFIVMYALAERDVDWISGLVERQCDANGSILEHSRKTIRKMDELLGCVEDLYTELEKKDPDNQALERTAKTIGK